MNTEHQGDLSQSGPALDSAATTIYRLASHVCHCMTVEGHIFLDLKRNRYFGIAKQQAPGLEILAESPALELPAESQQLPSWAQHLLKSALLEPANQIMAPRVTTSSTDAPLGGLTETPNPEDSVSAQDTFRFINAHLWARTGLRHRSLYEIAGDLHTRRALSPRNVLNEQKMPELIRRFRYVRPWIFASRNQCLLHALTLTRFLTAFGVHASWIIGIRTRPWAAHSWVQFGSWVLDDVPEHVFPYRPIMMV